MNARRWFTAAPYNNPSPPGHLERAVRIAEGLALRLDHGRIGAAVAEDRLEVEADRAGAVDRAVDRVIATQHAAAAWRLVETDVAELLKLIVEERLVLHELHQLGAVERFVDAPDA